MPFESSLPDPASVLGSTLTPSAAAASLWGPTPARASGATTGSAGDVGAAVYLNNKGYRRITGYDNSGNPSYRHLTPAELMRPEFRDQGTRLARDLEDEREGKLLARDARVRAEAERKWRAQLDLMRGELDLRGQEIRGSNQIALQNLAVTERANQRNYQHLSSALLQQAREGKEERAVRLAEMKNSSDQQIRLLAYKTESDEAQRDLDRALASDTLAFNRDRLEAEKGQFREQHALNVKNSHRAVLMELSSLLFRARR